ncbi:hypothetical protein OEZ85_004730 [Tetradesmus obliquus]|uniref:GCVT N-terminal domain-containing protein n=1 Tax=Tetradesmus obliquus TaxID=3088 RepID=A0ABY8UQ57_TETOB|nr:hypothetical protein OEZ85_004730 [Tetradesmus obliquus]
MKLRQPYVTSRSTPAAVAAAVPPAAALPKRRNSACCRHLAAACPSGSSSSSSSRLLPVARSTPSGLDLSALGIEVPDIDAADIASYQQELGAEFDAAGVAVTFNNTEKVVEALSHGVALVDRSHWGRLRVSGGDRLSLLHNQSTADFKQLKPGQGCDTVLVNAQARCLDLATALVLESSVMLLVSPAMRQPLLQRLDKFIFPADDVEVSDVSGRCGMLTILGSQADDVMQELAGDAFKLQGEPYCRHQLLRFGPGAPVIVAVGSGLAIPGYTLIVDQSGAADLYAALVNKGSVPMGEADWERARITQGRPSAAEATGCVPMGEADWERARVTQGRPAAGSELTQDFNPYEAGLCHAVSLDKGCYIGQETLAKLSNTNGVKQQLWGLQLSCRATPGAAITAAAAAAEAADSSSSSSSSSAAGEVLGRLTSYANLEKSGHFGLGYIRCRKGGVQVPLKGITVLVDGQPAKVVDVPYATRQLPSAGAADSSAAAAAAAEDSLQDRAAAAKQAKAAEKAAQEAAKAERLKAMQERLAAFQAAQQKPKQQ